MKTYVADTHSLIWYLQDNPRLSHRGRLLFSQADDGKASIVVPTIVLVEMTYLAEKKRIANALVKAALNLLRETSENYRLALLDLAVVEVLEQDRVPWCPTCLTVSSRPQRCRYGCRF